MDEYLNRARTEMFPKMKASKLSIAVIGEPDPKLCLEIGAAIMFDKPIVAVVPRGVKCPLSLRTIAHKILDDFDANDPASQERLRKAISDLTDAGHFRGPAR